jgi:hypothetical protein
MGWLVLRQGHSGASRDFSRIWSLHAIVQAARDVNYNQRALVVNKLLDDLG